jgi:hypothetical protein
MGGVRPLYGVFRVARDTRGADPGPRIDSLSSDWRVRPIRVAFHRNPRGAVLRKDGTRDALRQRGSLGL